MRRLKWVEDRIVAAVHEFEHLDGAWENDIYTRLIFTATGEGAWDGLRRGKKFNIVRLMLDALIKDNTVHEVFPMRQATGRRCFRVTNPLIRVAEAL